MRLRGTSVAIMSLAGIALGEQLANADTRELHKEMVSIQPVVRPAMKTQYVPQVIQRPVIQKKAQPVAMVQSKTYVPQVIYRPVVQVRPVEVVHQKAQPQVIMSSKQVQQPQIVMSHSKGGGIFRRLSEAAEAVRNLGRKRYGGYGYFGYIPRPIWGPSVMTGKKGTTPVVAGKSQPITPPIVGKRGTWLRRLDAEVRNLGRKRYGYGGWYRPWSWFGGKGVIPTIPTKGAQPIIPSKTQPIMSQPIMPSKAQPIVQAQPSKSYVPSVPVIRATPKAAPAVVRDVTPSKYTPAAPVVVATTPSKNPAPVAAPVAGKGKRYLEDAEVRALGKKRYGYGFYAPPPPPPLMSKKAAPVVVRPIITKAAAPVVAVAPSKGYGGYGGIGYY